jgi:putative PEP-CTERM system TPR-repeat lipoprotein
LGQLKEVEELLFPLEEASTDPEITNLLATSFFSQGRTEEGVELLRKVSSNQPDSSIARLKLAAGLIQSGDADAGLQHLEMILDMDPANREAVHLKVMVLLRSGELSAALTEAKRLRDITPDNYVTNNLLAQVLLANKNEPEAIKAFEYVLDLSPGNPFAIENLAFLAIKKKEYVKAQDLYSQALKKHPNNLSILLKMAALEGIDGKEKKMVERLQEVIYLYPNKVLPKVRLAQYYLEKNKPDSAVQVFVGVDKRVNEHPSVVNVLGVAGFQKRNYADSKKAFEQVLKVNSDAVLPRFYLALCEAFLGDSVTAMKQMARVLEISPGFKKARIELTRIQLSNNKLDDAVRNLELLSKIYPDDAEVLILKSVHFKTLGEHELALEQSLKAYTVKHTKTNLLIVVEQQLYLRKNKAAIKMLLDWLSSNHEDLEPREVLAGVYLNEGDKHEAVSHYLKILKNNPEHIIALNNLAWLVKEKDPKTGLEYAEKAVSLKPDSASILDTLALVLIENNKIRKAEKAIEKAVMMGPSNLDVRYLRAMIYSKLGKSSEAVKELNVLLSGGTDFSERKQALLLLKKLQQ